MYETVIDKKMLKLIMLKAGTLGFAGLTVLLAYQSRAIAAAAAGDAQCELSALQLSGIQAVMAGANASCAYNMTVGEAMVGGA